MLPTTVVDEGQPFTYVGVDEAQPTSWVASVLA